MRSESEVDAFKAEAAEIVQDCEICLGAPTADVCDCVRKFAFEVAAYESCIPKDFWYTRSSDITVNKSIFEDYIKKYLKKLNTAHRKGYGIMLSGGNGVGKSTFISYIGVNAIRLGKTVYYTTLPQLDHDLRLGFDDNETKMRMESMLTSDFLILDEMNKEFFRDLDKPTWFKTQIERLLKRRFDECKPVLMATNATVTQVAVTYGPAVASMISGKYQVLQMVPGDVRPKLSKKMKHDMNFEE